MIIRSVIETRTDHHGNECLIEGVFGKFDTPVYTVRYADSKRRWTKRDGSPYFASKASARKRIDTN